MKTILSAVISIVFAAAANAQTAFSDLVSLGIQGDGQMMISLPISAPVLVSEPLAPAAVKPSTNYQAVEINNDGSVTISKPMFSNPTGVGSIPISHTSDLTGVCKLFGLKAFRVGINFGDHAKTAVIAKSGKLSAIKSYSSQYFNHGITTLVCEQIPGSEIIPVRPTTEERVESVFANDDGSITLRRPFVMKDGKHIPISAKDSSADGVCKYFGLGSGVTVTTSGDHPLTFGISGNGKLSTVRYESPSYYNSCIDSVVCNPK